MGVAPAGASLDAPVAPGSGPAPAAPPAARSYATAPRALRAALALALAWAVARPVLNLLAGDLDRGRALALGETLALVVGGALVGAAAYAALFALALRGRRWAHVALVGLVAVQGLAMTLGLLFTLVEGPLPRGGLLPAPFDDPLLPPWSNQAAGVAANAALAALLMHPDSLAHTRRA